MSIRLATINKILNAFGLMLCIVVTTDCRGSDLERPWTELRLMTRNAWLKKFDA